MNILDAVKKSKLISPGCKLYYAELQSLHSASIINNWKITDGKYKNHIFTIPTDTKMQERIGLSDVSIYKYKNRLKKLGLIDILPKCTTRTNQRKNYHNRQLTVVMQILPKSLIKENLKMVQFAKSIKATANIIARFGLKLNRKLNNIHSKIKNILHNGRSVSKSNNKDVQAVISRLKQYQIPYQKSDLHGYVSLYKESQTIFIRTCIYCAGKDLYAPLAYFKKMFLEVSNDINFSTPKYDYEKLEEELKI